MRITKADRRCSSDFTARYRSKYDHPPTSVRGRTTYVAIGVLGDPLTSSTPRWSFPPSKNYLTIQGATNAKRRMEKSKKFFYVELWRIAP